MASIKLHWLINKFIEIFSTYQKLHRRAFLIWSILGLNLISPFAIFLFFLLKLPIILIRLKRPNVCVHTEMTRFLIFLFFSVNFYIIYALFRLTWLLTFFATLPNYYNCKYQFLLKFTLGIIKFQLLANVS